MGAGPYWDETLNFVRGCSPCSPGCDRCWAQRMAMRLSGPGRPYQGWLTGTAWYGGGNNMWCVLRGTNGGVENKGSHELYLTRPAKPRVKANEEIRKERLKKLMLAAADQENFLRAEQLRRVLRGEPAAKPRGGAQLFYIQDLRTTVGNCASWWRPSGCGYTSELSEAGLYTAEEIKRRGLDGDHKPWPREVVERAMCRHVRVEHLREVGRCEGAI